MGARRGWRMENKNRMLLVLKYLWEKTDENHTAGIQELTQYLLENGITVTTDSFSMFAVASTPKPKGSDNPKTGDANIAMNIAVLLAALSMVSFAGVYAKNKAEQY